MALVLDTGVLYAALDGADPDHERCTELLASTEEQFVIPAPVLAELDYFVRKFGSADQWRTFCEDVHAGAYALYPLDAALLLRCAELQDKYRDFPLGLVDAAVFGTCEVLSEDKVATLDHRHFNPLRRDDGSTLTLLP